MRLFILPVKTVLRSLRHSLATCHAIRLTVTPFCSDTPKPYLFTPALQSSLGPVQTNPGNKLCGFKNVWCEQGLTGHCNRDLKIRGQRRQRKRCWKSKFAFFQSWSGLLQVTNFVKCRQTFLKLNSSEPYPSSERGRKFRKRLCTSSVHVVVV